MYDSPITLMVKEMAERVAKQVDEETFKAVYSVVPTVDKDELLKALRYDRGQYEKGYADGKRDAMDELVRCPLCKYCLVYKEQDGNGFYLGCTRTWGLRGALSQDDYCSYGEEKEDDNE